MNPLLRSLYHRLIRIKNKMRCFIKEDKINELFRANPVLREELTLSCYLFEKYPKEEIYTYISSFLKSHPEAQGILSYLRTHFQRFLETFNLLGPGQPGEMLLDIGSCEISQLIFSRYTNYNYIGTYYGPKESLFERGLSSEKGEDFVFKVIGLDVEGDIFPWPSEHFDVVLFSEVLEHLSRDPMQALYEINRVLKVGGRLILTTPNIVRLQAIKKALSGEHPALYAVYNSSGSPDRHNREYTPWEVEALVKSAGFEIKKLITKFVWSEPDYDLFLLLFDLRKPLLHRGDCIFLLAQKIGTPKERYPSFLYV